MPLAGLTTAPACAKDTFQTFDKDKDGMFKREEIPEAFVTAIVLIDHFVREKSSLFVPDQDLFRHQTGEFLNTLINITRYEVLVASMELCVSLLDDWYPDLMEIYASSEDRESFLNCGSVDSSDRNPVINKDIDPLHVFKDSNDVEPDVSIPMEDWRVNSLG